MVQSGLEIFLQKIPAQLNNKKVGVLCHAPSVNSSYNHILELITKYSSCKLCAVFGPQHGLFGQTQDNMVEWEGDLHPTYNVPVYSLYGKNRKPSSEMLENLDALIIDLQDVGARPYTYIWTIKLCMEVCIDMQIPIWLLDRPNPISFMEFDGPILKEDFFSFVGGAEVPMCHRMTIGEMAMLLKHRYFSSLDLNVVWMKGWSRQSLFNETDFPWIMPSPNMPTLNTAVIYPGMVLLEGTNLSEGRGTTIPFELFGAPYIKIEELKRNLMHRKIPGCIFREHNFIPSFQKWHNQYCYGMQIHVTDIRSYLPVFTAASIIEAVIETSGDNNFLFKDPPYEYEYEKMPFDILSGDNSLRECLINRGYINEQREKWLEDINSFKTIFHDIIHYPEKKA